MQVGLACLIDPLTTTTTLEALADFLLKEPRRGMNRQAAHALPPAAPQQHMASS